MVTTITIAISMIVTIIIITITIRGSLEIQLAIYEKYSSRI